MDGDLAQRSDTSVIGSVVSVTGSQVIVLLNDGTSAREADLQVGCLVKFQTDYASVYGTVTGMTIPLPSDDPGERQAKIIELELLGEVPHPRDGKRMLFSRGISHLPTLGDETFKTTSDDLTQVYAGESVGTASIGVVSDDRTIPARVLVDKLVNGHFAVLGSTGSGKSCGTAVIIQQILEQTPNGHILILDPHNEYARAFGDSAELLNPDNLELPYWMLNFEELLDVVTGEHAKFGSPEAEILSDIIPAAKREYLGTENPKQRITADTPIPYRLSDVAKRLDEEMGKLDNKASIEPYRRIKYRLNMLQTDSRFSFMFGGIGVHDKMAQILSRIFRIPVDGKPVSIVDLSGVPSEIVNVVVSVLCRLTFDLALWSNRELPILLVCEEAHKYAPFETDVRFELSQKMLSRIAKEGRKYGVSLCIVSQRPSRLSSDLLSQCNTIFALRMSNNEDREFLRGALSESSLGLFEFLPALRSGEAIGVGPGVATPFRFLFSNLPDDRRPDSGAIAVTSAWQADTNDVGFLETVIRGWRNQQS